jgi:hypothetical protein
MLWNELLGWSDLLLFCVMYFFSTMGTTVCGGGKSTQGAG